MPNETTKNDREQTERSKTDFINLTGIEPLENDESNTLKAKMTEAAEAFLKPIEQSGLITNDVAEEIVLMWKKAITLDNEGMRQLVDVVNKPYAKAVQDLQEVGPAGENEQIQSLIRDAKRLIETNSALGKAGLAFIYRHNPFPKTQQAEAQTTTFIVINTEANGKDLDEELRIKMIVCEESLHLISRLRNYGEAFNKKWVEEMMARVLSAWLESGYQSLPSDKQEQAKREGRLSDYGRLFYSISKLIGDESTLIKMFFGKEPANSDNVVKARNAVNELDLVAQLVDAGVSIDSLSSLV